jgi:DNA-binding CsgD family transcriptional regulator
MREGAVERLSAGQRDCLRLVLQGYEFKEIARLLETSPGAINERLREARRTLGVSSSREAARMLAAHETSQDYTSHVATPNGVGSAGASANLTRQTDTGSAGEPSGRVVLKDVQAAYDATGVGKPSTFPWPIPTREKPDNDLTLRETILTVLGLTIGLGMAALVAIALVDQLTRLRLG